MAEKVRCHPTFRLHSVHVQGQVASSGSIAHVKAGAPSRAEADLGISAGFRSRSLAGHGWGRWGPIEEQDLGHSVSLTGRHPTLHRGHLKGVARSR